jgi:hypothetical protein
VVGITVVGVEDVIEVKVVVDVVVTPPAERGERDLEIKP